MAINRREFLKLTAYAAPTLTLLASCQPRAEMPQQFACAPDLCGPQKPCPPITCQPVQCQPWSCAPVGRCSPFHAKVSLDAPSANDGVESSDNADRPRAAKPK